MAEARESELEALGAFLRSRRLAAGLSLRELARRTQVSNAYLSQVERGRHEPSLSVLRTIAAALDLSLESLLVSAGLLERGDPAAALDTEAAIRQDPKLSEPERMALLSVYRGFMMARPQG